MIPTKHVPGANGGGDRFSDKIMRQESSSMTTGDGARRRNRRYLILVGLVLAAMGGWSAFWYFAAGQAEKAIAGWRAREAQAGRIYTCGEQNLRGFPFRIEVDCTPAAATFTSGGVKLTVETKAAIVAAQIYQPGLLISELQGPLTFGEAGKAPEFVATWKQAVSSVAGNPTAPQRVALVFDQPSVARMDGGSQMNVLKADHVEIHGRLVGGSVWDKPVIEVGLSLQQAAMPAVNAVAKPVDGEIVATLHGLKDFSPKPWPARFREIQAAGGFIEITRARLQQGETVAIGAGKLSLNAQGYLQGTLNVTASGLEHFLNAIGADMAIKKSPEMDKVAGFLDRLAPGLGNVAREQAGAHLSFGIKAIEGNATLEGKPAVALPLTFDNGAVSLGMIPLGRTPSLF